MIIRNAEQSDFDFIYKTWKENQKYGMSIPRKVRINERIEKKEMFILEDDNIIIGMFNLHTRKLPKSWGGGGLNYLVLRSKKNTKEKVMELSV